MRLEELPPTCDRLSQRDYEALQRELLEVRSENRGLLRQLKKVQNAATEAQRAHAKMVATLTETMRENITLTTDRDLWKARALRQALDEEPTVFYGRPIDITNLAGQITEDEVNAIRKAMARLHHPDVGGNPERMKAWNSALDRLER